MGGLLFPFADYWWFYAGFLGLILGMLALDLGVFNRDAHAVTMKEATGWSIFWICFALLFNFGLWQYAQTKFPEAVANRVGMEFLAGFVIEKALAVDNIFVFVLVFSALGIPQKYQHRVLFFGILGALVFRAIFIAIGAQLMQYQWVLVVFGVFLILTGVKMLFASDMKVAPKDSKAVKLLSRIVPITSEFHGQKFLIRKGGRTFATPLLVALVFLEASDIVFAIDSVPAIFAITREPMLVFTSNILAILGLRSLYFLLAGVVDRFVYLKYGLAAVLVLVGLKMAWLNQAMGGHFPIGLSLALIAGMIGLSVVASLIRTSPARTGGSRVPGAVQRKGA